MNENTYTLKELLDKLKIESLNVNDPDTVNTNVHSVSELKGSSLNHDLNIELKSYIYITKDSLQEIWDNVCNEYVRVFCEKHDYEFIEDFWVAGNVGTIICLGDMFVSMDDIRYDVDNNVPVEKFEVWYWKSIDRADKGLKYLNYSSFCKGAPDPIPQSVLDLYEQAMNEIEKYKTND